METILESPTFEEYTEVMADGLRLGGEMVDIPDDVNLQDAAHHNNWNTIETWFTNTFDGQEQQRSQRANIQNMYQTLKETPRQFFIRITIALRDAGYQAAIIDELAETMWMMGIHKDVQ